MLSRILSSCCQSLKQLRGYRQSTRLYSEKSTTDKNDEINQESDITELLKGAANFNETTDTTWSTTPYPQDAPSTSPDEKTIEKPKLDPIDASVLMFPGQGILKVGMVKQYMKFPRVKELFENANEALGYDLENLCLKGPQERLDRTEFNQPATVVASLAALEKLWEERPRAVESCKAVAGYSVGEITALIFSGAMSVEAGIRLAGVRGAAMQRAAEKIPQGMIHAFCSASAKASKLCQDAEEWALDLGVEDAVCRTAVYLYTQGKIFAGNEEALRYIEKNGQALGFCQIRRIPVSGAFHTKLMKPALKPFMKALGAIDLEEPKIDVFSNVNARPYGSRRIIQKLLPKQIVAPVQWEQILHAIYERPADTAFPRTFDLGSNGTMMSILKRVNAKAWDHCYDL